ncbi:hypothetical protein KCU87_g68, partial [Aureobasidium melanogenum]
MILDDWLNWYWLSSLDTLQWNACTGLCLIDDIGNLGGDSRLVISASVDVVALGGDSRRLLICILNDTVRKRCERLSRGKLRERATGGSGSSSSMIMICTKGRKNITPLLDLSIIPASKF